MRPRLAAVLAFALAVGCGRGYLDPCLVDDDCPEDWGCASFSGAAACAPRCSVDEDCELDGAGFCVSGACALYCESDEDCPDGATCEVPAFACVPRRD